MKIQITDLIHWEEVLLDSPLFRYFKAGEIKRGKKFELNGYRVKDNGQILIVRTLIN